MGNAPATSSKRESSIGVVVSNQCSATTSYTSKQSVNNDRFPHTKVRLTWAFGLTFPTGINCIRQNVHFNDDKCVLINILGRSYTKQTHHCKSLDQDAVNVFYVQLLTLTHASQFICTSMMQSYICCNCNRLINWTGWYMVQLSVVYLEQAKYEVSYRNVNIYQSAGAGIGLCHKGYILDVLIIQVG